MRTPGMPLILVADDHAAVRHELALLLADQSVGDCCEACDMRRPSRPSRASCRTSRWWDLSPGTEGALLLVGELCARNIAVLVCSIHEEPGYVRSLQPAPTAISRKARLPGELARVVRGILEGWMLISPLAGGGTATQVSHAA